nr:hypothetical protein BAR15_120250 [Bartonella sp. AR 15-3]
MIKAFHYKKNSQDGCARQGEIITGRGRIRTPAFMPVGTAGTVKAMYMDQLHALGADIILGNTYQLMLRPGAERIARLGGGTRICSLVWAYFNGFWWFSGYVSFRDM